MNTPPTPSPPPRAALGKSATLKDIAQAADVSIWLASSVLNNRHAERRIASQTVEKVLKVAADLGYLPNVGARQLRKNSGQARDLVLAIMTSTEAPLSLTNHYIRCLHEMSLSTQGGQPVHVSLAIEMYSAGRLSELRGILSGDRFNAAIITNTTTPDDAFLAAHRLPYPVVVANRDIPGYSCVIDSPTLGEEAARVLLDTGSARPAVLLANLQSQSVERRRERFLQAIESRLGEKPAVIQARSFSVQHASEAVQRFFAGGGRTDGLFCLTDGLAQGAYHAIKEHGLKIPEDVTVVGIGDYEASPYFDPPLTSVGVPPVVIGEAVSELLGEQLRGVPIAPRTLKMPVTVSLQRSTARRPGTG